MGYILFGLLLFIIPYGSLIYLIYDNSGLVDKLLVVITLVTLIVDKFSLDLNSCRKYRECIAKFFATSALFWFLSIWSVMSLLSAIFLYCNNIPLWIANFVIAVIVGVIAFFLYWKKEEIETSKGIAFGVWYIVVLVIYVSNWIYVANK